MKITVFYGNQPMLNCTTYEQEGPNKGRKYGLNRDRCPDRDHGQLHNTALDCDYCKEVELTPELRITLLEDLAYAYGSNTVKFRAKLIEFGLI
jgi:hypothetical protein